MYHPLEILPGCRQEMVQASMRATLIVSHSREGGEVT